MANRTSARWKEFLGSLALSALFGWGTFSGFYFEESGWKGLVMSISAVVMTPFAFSWTLFSGASLLCDWTDEEERARENAIESWFLGCLGIVATIALALLLLVGVIWLIKTIWYAV